VPCQAFLAQLCEARPAFDERGADLAAVGRASADQARHLRDDKGVDVPLWLDPETRVNAALGLTGFAWWKYLLPTTWWSYARWITKARQGRIARGSVTAQPALVIVDPAGRVAWSYEGSVVGDYPTVDEVVAALGAVTG
jgi:peroxiredoxin